MNNNLNKKNILLLGNGLGQLGSSILSFVLGLRILKSLDSVFLYSFSQVIGPLVAILILPILGSAIDKFNKNKLISLSQLASCLGLLIFTILNGGSSFNFIEIIFLLTILKISDQVLSTTLNASTVNVIRENEVQDFRSKLQLIQSASMVFSPILAVFILDRFSLRSLLILEIFIEFIVLLIYSRVDFRNKESEEEIVSQSLFSLFKEGINFIFSYKKIVFGFSFVLMINFVLGIVNVGIPYIEINYLELSNKAYAINDSILAIGLIIGSLLASRISSKGSLNVAKNSIGMIGIVTLILGILLAFNFNKLGGAMLVGLYFAIIGIAITVCNILISSRSIIKIPKEYQGRVFSVLNALSQVSLPISMLFYGFILDLVNFVPVFIISALILLLITYITPWAFRIDLKNDNLE